MLVCIKRGCYVRGNFQDFYRSCYKILLGKLTLTREDFVDYLNLTHPKHQALSQYTRVDHVPQVGLGETANYNTKTETKEIGF